MATVMDSERIGYRASTKNLVLRCSFKGNGFCFATSFKTWQNLHDEIFERFKFKKIEKIRIQYTLPGTEACFLENESNYKMLLFGAELYKFDFVELTVSNEDIFTSSSSTISHVDTFLAPEDEEEHLGPAFRCEVTKPFLSEEWKTYIVSVDQRFAGIHDFREKLKKYAIVKGFMYRFIRNDATRIHVICNSGGPDVKCNWYIKGTVSNANNSFSIAEMDNVHSCKRVISSHAHDYLDASIVASCILEEVMYNLTITPKTIISRFKATYGFKISYKVALRAIGKAKDFLYGNDAKSFNRLKWFREAVLLSNPGSVFDLEKDSVTSRFKRLFIAYGGSIKGFQHCLPILYVDGAHGKSVYKGQILSATGRTGNKGIGHLVSTVEMAKVLISREKTLSITILVMKLRIDPTVSAYTQSFSSNSNIEFVDLPPPDLSSLPASSSTFLLHFTEAQKPHVRDVVAKRLHSGDHHIAGFVIDMFCTCMIDVAAEFGLPSYVFFTSSASFLSLAYRVQSLVDDENVDVTSLDEKDELCVPGFVNRVPCSVLPTVFLEKDSYKMFVSLVRSFKETKGIMINTFREMESYAIESLSNDEKLPPIYPMGPVLNLVNEDNDKKREIIDWLDQQPESSVVFLCFGSMGNFEEEQVKEIAKGLERSEQRFLWSLRRPVEKGKMEFPGEFSDPNEILPDGFLERTKEIGKVVGWAPQVTVLSHQSVGGFVSHCGWNSTLESVWCGVPLATWPMYAEQQVNAFQFVKEFGLAVEIKMDYKMNLMTKKVEIVCAKEIAIGIRKLMEDSEVRKKVKDLKDQSRMAVSESGSSFKAIDLFIQNINVNS